MSEPGEEADRKDRFRGGRWAPGAERGGPARVDAEGAPALVWAGRPGHPPPPPRPCTHTHTHTQALLHTRSQPCVHTPPTLIRCLLTHLVKVFFCTASRSSMAATWGHFCPSRTGRLLLNISWWGWGSEVWGGGREGRWPRGKPIT